MGCWGKGRLAVGGRVGWWEGAVGSLLVGKYLVVASLVDGQLFHAVACDCCVLGVDRFAVFIPCKRPMLLTCHIAQQAA
jgi:hypothetical protein